MQRGSVLASYCRILAVFLALAASALAQASSGNFTTPVAAAGDAGKKKISVTDKKGNLTVGKVHIWEPMSETWVEITPSSITPNPGNDPVITLPSDVRQGDKFKIAWTSDSPDGGVEKTTYTS